jgi:tRNA nucleotidyltransferase (CCA-adding enzyme)
MKDFFPIRPEAVFILQQLVAAGYEAFVVGGAVRDTLLESTKNKQEGTSVYLNATTDYDFTTNATPEKIQELFPESFCENEFGTVSISQEHLLAQMQVKTVESTSTTAKKSFDIQQATKLHTSLEKNKDSAEPISQTKQLLFEITTYRSQEKYEDFRKPTSLQWGSTLSEDLMRRDFSINALAVEISPEYLEQAKGDWLADLSNEYPGFRNVPTAAITVVDEHQGLDDLDKKIIRTVGGPSERFAEDALRMLRTIRFSVQLNMSIDPETFDALTQQAELLKHISGERIRDEFLKMISSNFPKEAVTLLDETGLLKEFLPELLAAKEVQQGGHHTTDVWVHSLDALDSCPSPDPIVRLATLLHDIGKPVTYELSQGKPTFYNHEVVGARIAKNIAQRLKLSKKEIDRVFLLVRHHMFYYQPENSDASIRRFMRKVGIENLDDILALREGDRLGSGARKTSWRLEEMKERMHEQLHQPMDLGDLAINGSELMEALSLEPGPQIGKLLHHLFELVLDSPELNQKEELLKLARVFTQS